MERPIRIPTDRSFGLTFAVVFGLIGAWLLWDSSRFAFVSLAAAAIFALLAFIAPRVLHPLNVAWMYLGLALNRVVSPLVMGVVFFAVFTPVALVLRAKGRDALRRGFERNLATYWIDRIPPGPDGKTLPRQF